MSANPYFQPYADWLRWRAGRFTAGPPQLLSQYGIQLGDPNARFAALPIAFTEITGIPSLVRWGQAILQNKPIAEVEKGYYTRLAHELGVDPEEFKKRVEQATMHAALVALPLAVPFSKAEAVRLAEALGIGFGFVGGPTAIIRSAQGYQEETLKAFIETGLAGSVLADVASALKDLAARLPPDKIDAVHRQITRQQRNLIQQITPEDVAFEREVVEALRALKSGDTSKYDALVRQFEEWQKTVDEFKRLYEARQKGPLSPEDEARYTKLLQEVARIRDRYDILKSYIDTAREMGLELQARQIQFEGRTVEDLARAAGEMPPGPPPKDFMMWLEKVDLGILQKLVKDPATLSRFARRFGVDEQTLAERAALFLRERQWENLANSPAEELRKILMDESLLRKYASELGLEELKLRERLEELLQQRMGLAPPKVETSPERPPIEPIRKEAQFRPPETEVEGGRGQVLIVKAEEEPKLTVRRLEELPSVEERLRAIARRRLRTREKELERELERIRGTAEDAERVRRRRPEEERGQRTDQTTDSTTGDRDTAGQPTRTDGTTDQTTHTTTDRIATVTTGEREVVVLGRNTLRMFIPALPAYVFAMPAVTVLAMIGRAVGAPVTLPPNMPRPLPREPFGNWLDRVFAGSGFSWRSLAAQRESFVFA